MRYRRDELDALVDAINATGYGLTLGVHTRIDETIDARRRARARAGNVYVNRNMVGAVVGVQPFGGEGLSGTGPKAGGPLYLPRLVRHAHGDAMVAVRRAGASDDAAAHLATPAHRASSADRAALAATAGLDWLRGASTRRRAGRRAAPRSRARRAYRATRGCCRGRPASATR